MYTHGRRHGDVDHMLHISGGNLGFYFLQHGWPPENSPQEPRILASRYPAEVRPNG
jgi:hypothetical protein